jgi:O-antigen ligase
MDLNTFLKKFYNKSHVGIIFVLAAPTLAIAISQTIRNDFYPNNWDAPVRMLLCVPIYLAISQGWIIKGSKDTVILNWIRWTVPLALISILICRAFIPATNWGGYSTTYFVDPLSFCTYTLLFTFLAIIGLTYNFKELNTTRKYFYVVTISIGFYLSGTSGARTGWLSLPFFVLIIHALVLKEINKKQQIFGILILMTGLVVLMYTNNLLINKLILGWQEVLKYKINEINEDTSVGMRISFYRIGFSYFFERPFAGWGDLSWMGNINNREFLTFASIETLVAARHGFHSEVITHSVRSGIWGLIATLSLYVVVFYQAVKGLKMQLGGQHQLISISILVTVIHLFITGLSTEATNLTFLSAFIGIVISVLLGEQKYLEESHQITKKFTSPSSS